MCNFTIIKNLPEMFPMKKLVKDGMKRVYVCYTT
jgi:hypothetical protein